jgi:hypothetical protein
MIGFGTGLHSYDSFIPDDMLLDLNSGLYENIHNSLDV